jgi:hypothetical protein
MAKYDDKNKTFGGVYKHNILQLLIYRGYFMGSAHAFIHELCHNE